MNNTFRYLMYRSEEQAISVNAVIRDETVWLTQKSMAELFGVHIPAINKHLKNIFAEGELDEKVVISKMEITTQHGAVPDKTQTKETLFYNLDAIISVGYRVNSRRATQFRIWATSILKEYMIKGFAMDVRCFFGTIVKVLKSDGVVEGGTGEMKKREETDKQETQEVTK